jgi:hypothetical protein
MTSENSCTLTPAVDANAVWIKHEGVDQYVECGTRIVLNDNWGILLYKRRSPKPPSEIDNGASLING